MEWVFLWAFVVMLSLAADLMGVGARMLFGVIIVWSLSLFVGFRVQVGTDYAGYLYRYNELLEGSSLEGIFEPGFLWLMRLSMELGVGFHGLMFIVALLTFACFYVAIVRLSPSVLVSTVVLFGLGVVGIATNQIRQTLAVGIILLGLPFIWNAQLFRWFLVVGLASMFHITAVIVFPFYWVSRCRIPRLFLLSTLLFSAALFLGGEFRELLRPGIAIFADPMGLSHYVEMIWQDSPRLNTGLRIFSYIGIAVAMLLYSRRLFKSDEMKLRVCSNLFFIGLIAAIGFSTFWQLPRLSMYFMSASILFFPLSGKLVKNWYSRYVVMLGVCAYWSVLYFYQIIFAPGDLLPYQSIFWSG